MTTYYVSSEVGNNNNAGTSASAPLASLQTAANLVKPGDTVEVINGTYTAPFYGDALDITTSGTASAPITFEAAPGATPVIDSSGGWNAIKVTASYITIKGFTVVGDAAKYTLSSALAGYSTGSSQLDGNGIVVVSSSGVPLPNHVTIENNTVYNEPGGGIDTGGADYVQILNNVVHNNGNWSAFGCSGISITTSQNLNSAAGAHIVVSGNLVYDNAQLVPTDGAGKILDGEGIILDTNPNYTNEILVENNTIYGNGSTGIASFLTNGAVITGNTVYGNDTQNVQPASDAQIDINQSTDTVTNNNTSNPNVAAPLLSGGAVNANGSVTLTGTAAAGSTVSVSDGGSSALGTTTASTAGAWSFTTTILAAGAYKFSATDTTSVGTSKASTALGLTVSATTANTNAPGAPVITGVVENSDLSVTVTGTAVANSTVGIKCNGGAMGTTTVNSAGVWSFTTGALNPAPYGFTATDTTPGGTSAASVAVGLTVTSKPVSSHAPSAPVITSVVETANDAVTVTGTAAANSTVSLKCNGGAMGTATVNSAGAWSFTTGALDPAPYGFTATDTTSGGTSAVSAAVGISVVSKIAVATAAAAAAAPIIVKGVANANGSVTLTGTAAHGAKVTVRDGERRRLEPLPRAAPAAGASRLRA